MFMKEREWERKQANSQGNERKKRNVRKRAEKSKNKGMKYTINAEKFTCTRKHFTLLRSDSSFVINFKLSSQKFKRL